MTPHELDKQRLLKFFIEVIKQRDELLAACEYLLLSADASWEINRGGHDWAEACEEARAAIVKIKKAIRTLDSEREVNAILIEEMEREAYRALIRELAGALDYYLSNGDIGNTIDIARAALAKAEEVLG